MCSSAGGWMGQGACRRGERAISPPCCRACLVAIRLPEDGGALYQVPGPPFWSLADATERLRAMLRLLGEEGAGMEAFLPDVPATVPEQELRCRVAVAGTVLAGFEFARQGRVQVQQQALWASIHFSRRETRVGEVGAQRGERF